MKKGLNDLLVVSEIKYHTDNSTKKFNFKNSISDLFKHIGNKIKHIGDFDIESGKIYVASPMEHTLKKPKLYPLNNAAKGKWCAYYIGYKDHWNKRPEGLAQKSWEGCAIAIHEKVKFSDLDKLTWTATVAPVNNYLGIFDAKSFGNINYLSDKMIETVAKSEKANKWNSSKKWYGIILKWFYIKNFVKHLLLPNGCIYETPEMRGRDYMYGKDDKGKIIVIIIPSLF
jgi:hypothetical protein